MNINKYRYSNVLDNRDDSSIDVSIVIPFYNRSKMVINSILSVQLQKTGYLNVEVIAVDDGSSEQVDYEILDDLEGILLLKLSENSGANTARNLGLLHARGRYVLFLDSDDELLPDSIELLFKAIDVEQNNVVAVSGSLLFISNKSAVVARSVFIGDRAFKAMDVVAWNPVGALSKVIFRKSVVLDVGGFSENLVACQDWELYIRVLNKGLIKSSSSIVVKYLVHGESTTSALDLGVDGRLFIEQNHLKSCVFYTTVFLVNNIIFFFRRGGGGSVLNYFKSRNCSPSVVHILLLPFALSYLIYVRLFSYKKYK